MKKYMLYGLATTDAHGTLEMKPTGIELTQDELEAHIRLHQRIMAFTGQYFDHLAPILVGEGDDMRVFFYSHSEYMKEISTGQSQN